MSPRLDRPEDYEQMSPSIRSNIRLSNRGVDAGTSVKSMKSFLPSFSNLAPPKSYANSKEALVCGKCGKEVNYKISPHQRVHCVYCGFKILDGMPQYNPLEVVKQQFTNSKIENPANDNNKGNHFIRRKFIED